jgi:hypothetical protein
METIRTRTHVENGHITVDVPARWNNKDVDVVLVADESPAVPAGVDENADAKMGNGAHLMAIAEAIVAKGGVVWPTDVMEWQRAERQDRPLPGRE